MSSLRLVASATALAALSLMQPASAAASAHCAAAAWIAPGGGTIAAPALLAAMSRKQAVLLGEQHDNDDHHRWQLQVIAALHAQRPDMVLGFEMFPRRVQPVLDRWVAGELSPQQLLEQTGWTDIWNFPPALYLPLFEFARLNRVPMLALNVDRKLNRAVSARGWDAVAPAEREGLGRPAPPSDAYRNYLFDIYRIHAQHAGMGTGKSRPSANDSGFHHFVESQLVWDRAMAEAIAGAARGGALLVGVMGGGHVRHGYGVPHQLRDLGIREIGTLLPMAAEEACARLAPGLADAVFALPPAVAAPEPPRLGVRLEETEAGVRVTEVGAGSVAERSGIRANDRLLEVGGSAVARARHVIDAVRQQPAGSWLPVRVLRGEQVLELVLRFPARP